MPHKDPDVARAWRRNWWKTATKARADQNAAARRRHMEINDFLREHKLRVGCSDCGYCQHHSALEFHHRGDKEINLSFAKSLEQAKQEMEKCDVVCANCHRVRHWNKSHPCKPDIFAATYEAAASPAEGPTNNYPSEPKEFLDHVLYCPDGSWLAFFVDGTRRVMTPLERHLWLRVTSSAEGPKLGTRIAEVDVENKA